MKRLITACPSCRETMKIAAMKCPGCGLELRSDFEPSVFDRLGDEEYDFLMSFLKNRGSLKGLQDELGISYPLAKKKLDALLGKLGLESSEDNAREPEQIDLSGITADKTSVKASEIIKARLKEAGGRVLIHTARGLPCEITACADGRSFASDKLPIKPPYRYEVFDIIVQLLLANGGRARKGNGRNSRLGDPDCDETTVVGAVAARYAGKKYGDSVYDPVFVLAAVLEWAGIATNERGEIVLTASYRGKLSCGI